MLIIYFLIIIYYIYNILYYNNILINYFKIELIQIIEKVLNYLNAIFIQYNDYKTNSKNL